MHVLRARPIRISRIVEAQSMHGLGCNQFVEVCHRFDQQPYQALCIFVFARWRREANHETLKALKHRDGPRCALPGECRTVALQGSAAAE